MVILVVAMVVLRASPSFASGPPPNDNFVNATVISSTPFNDTVDTTDATAAPDDPADCGTPANTVWYAITAATDEIITVNTFLPSTVSPQVVSVFTGAEGALSLVVCGRGPTNPTSWAAAGSITYYVMLSSLFGFGGPVLLQVTASVPPANDDFDNATVISAVPFTDTVDATAATSAPDDPTACGGSANSVWYSLNAAVDETVSVAVSGASGQIPQVSAYSGVRGSLTQVACSDPAGGTASWVATSGVTYHIMVADPGPPPAGTITLQLNAFAEPANDDFGNATAINSLPFTATEDAAGATTAPDDPTGCGDARSVWYSLVATVAETVIVNTADAPGFGNTISVYTGNRGALTQVACSSFPGSAAQFSAVAGVTYHILVAQPVPFGGDDQWTINVVGVATPVNDDFDHATVVTTLPFTDSLDTTGATTAPDDPGGCFVAATNNTVWYQIAPAVNELLVADTTGSAYTPIVSAYTGSRGALTQVACGGASAMTSFQATAGVTYFIMVAETPEFGPAGLLKLSLRGFTPPPNDDISNATTITTLPYFNSVDTTDASTVPTDPTACFQRPAATVWYRFTAPVSGTIEATTAGSGYNASVSSYAGPPSALTSVTCGIVDTPAFSVAQGVTYYFEISSRYTSTGGTLDFAVTSPRDSSGTGPCTRRLTGTITSTMTVSSGTTCLANATVDGPVIVRPGTQLLIVDSTVKGGLVSDGASALTICDSSVAGATVVQGTTGFVLIGDGGAAGSTCIGNQIRGSVVIGGGESNTGGVDLGGNTITGQVAVSENHANPASDLNPEDAAIEIDANHVAGVLTCGGNTPAPVNDALPNVVTGSRTGQCAAL